MSVTALDIVRAAREYAADPEHIVTDPESLYETASGDASSLSDGNASRGCLIGITGIVCNALRMQGVEVGRAECEADAEVGMIAEAEYGGYTEAVAAGHAAILSTLDQTIAVLEARS